MGVLYRCPRMGGWDKGNTPWRRISQSEIQKIAATKKEAAKARAGKNSFPPTPFLFARPSDWISKLRIRIFVKKSSNFAQKTPPIFTFSEIERCCLGAKRLGMVFFRRRRISYFALRNAPPVILFA